MKRMLINATQEEELRVAIVDGQKLYDLDIEVDSSRQKKANIYKGKITRIEPSLDAAFVDYGAERHGFLPLKDISREYFLKEPSSGQRINIKEVLKEGQEIVVQVDKDERGNKGAALTTFISLAGRFIVLMPNNPRGGGVSRRIAGEDREDIRRVQKQLEVPPKMSCIVRTAGIGRSVEELEWDLQYLKSVWDAILQVVVQQPAPFLIYQDSSPIVRALRDHFNADIGEITIDDKTAFEEAREFVEQVMPHNIRKLKLYEDEVPLFTRFQIESQIESAFAHSVNLPSGGSIVIDHTEALVSIDINSARATRGGDIEATALATNLEAADEIARQCRIRDLGGLLVIDFIDMGPNRNQREVENRLRDAVRTDRARVQIGRISRFGLLEMSRQRLRRSLGESANQICPRCNGSGVVRSVESLALAILRLLGEEARKDRTAKVIAELPIDVATFLLNEKREWIHRVEQQTNVELLLVANAALETPNYTLRRVRDDQVLLPENTGSSYDLVTPEADVLEEAQKLSTKTITEKPAVAGVKPETPAPTPIASNATKVESGGGLFAAIKKLFGGDTDKEADKPARDKPSDSARNSRGKKSNARQSSRRDTRGRRKAGGERRTEAAADNADKANNGQQQDSGRSRPNKAAPKNADDSNGTARKRRRRRRPSGRNRNSANDDGASKQNTAGENNQQAGAPAPRQLQAQDSGGAQTTSSNQSAADAAAPPERVMPVNGGKRAETTEKSSGDKDRLLPWESSAGETKQSYKVWSSDEQP